MRRKERRVADATDQCAAYFDMEANAHLKAMRSQPRRDTAPLRDAVRRKEAVIGRLMKMVGNEDNDAVRQRYHNEVRQHEIELQGLRARIQEAEAHNDVPVARLSRADVDQLVSDLWGLLNAGDPGEVAPVLRALFGQIRITARAVDGEPKPAWVGQFEVDLVKALVVLGAGRPGPTTSILGRLSACGWTLPANATVLLINEVSP